MKNLKKLLDICKLANSNFSIVIIKYFFYQIKGKNILSDYRTRIKGLTNISTDGLLKIGLNYTGFTNNKDATYLNVRGKLHVLGNFSLGRGCRVDIGDNATVSFGEGTYINPFTKIIIMHSLELGKECAISWSCQFLDDDFHEIQYEGKKDLKLKGINIGDRVWIGSNVSVFKGTVIPNGCVIASNSVVKGVFNEENTLIAGNPAKVIKRRVSWK